MPKKPTYDELKQSVETLKHQVEAHQRGYFEDQREQKLRTLRTLSSGLAQDFNEILMAIMGYVELAQYDIAVSHPARQNLTQAMKAIDRAKDLVTDCLTYSRVHEKNKSNLDMKAIVTSTLEQFKKSLPAKIVLKEDIAEEVLQVNANAALIRQVVTNLCTNASNAMLENGGALSVGLCAETVEIRDDLAQKAPVAGEYVKLTVSDSGTGMDAETLSQAFDPYFTTLKDGASSGMGLALVDAIVNASLGYIFVESKAEKGTTVTVCLPKVEATSK